MTRLALFCGSTAKWRTPASFSYGPAAPKVWPASTSVRDFTSMRTSSAQAGVEHRSNIAVRILADMGSLPPATGDW
jgi:hypothetical protein